MKCLPFSLLGPILESGGIQLRSWPQASPNLCMPLTKEHTCDRLKMFEKEI